MLAVGSIGLKKRGLNPVWHCRILIAINLFTGDGINRLIICGMYRLIGSRNAVPREPGVVVFEASHWGT